MSCFFMLFFIVQQCLAGADLRTDGGKGVNKYISPDSEQTKPVRPVMLNDGPTRTWNVTNVLCALLPHPGKEGV